MYWRLKGNYWNFVVYHVIILHNSLLSTIKLRQHITTHWCWMTCWLEVLYIFIDFVFYAESQEEDWGFREFTTCDVPSIDFLSQNPICALSAVWEKDRQNRVWIAIRIVCACVGMDASAVFVEGALLTDKRNWFKCFCHCIRAVTEYMYVNECECVSNQVATYLSWVVIGTRHQYQYLNTN